MTITLDLAAARSAWGRKALPMGAILCGLCDDRALLWLPIGWHLGAQGAYEPAPAPDETRRVWLKAIRERHGWDAAAAMGVTRRTWEGWELGRPFPSPTDAIYRLYTLYLADTERP